MECSANHCASAASKSGYCPLHLQRLRRSGSTDVSPRAVALASRTRCALDGCELVATPTSLCVKHTKRQPSSQCAADGCDRAAGKGSHCSLHYQRLKRTGTVLGVRLSTPPKPEVTYCRCGWKAVETDVCSRHLPQPLCRASGCDRKTHGLGYCHTHYARLRNSGSVELLPRRSRESKPRRCAMGGCDNPFRARGALQHPL